MVKATVSEVIRTRVPEWVSEKDLFMKFVEYYYEWMEQDDRPTKFLRSMGEKTDIDQIDDEYVELILNKIISFIPNDIQTDRRFLTKHIREFLRAKGTDESLSFIMKAVFGEDAHRVPMSQFVLRSSDNEYTQDGYIALETDLDTNFSDAIGSTLIQLGIPASAKIESATFRALPDGRTFWLVRFDPRKVNGSFTIGQQCRAIKNDVDLTFNEIKEYSVVIQLDVETNQLRFTSDYEFIFFEGELVLGLNETFRGVISSVVQYLVINGKHDYTVELASYTGSISDGAEVYLTTPRDEFEHITKNSFCYGQVSPSVADYEIIDGGSGYYEGITVSYSGGSGDGVSGYVGEISPGSVDDIIILNGGSGYQAGDKITIDDNESSGNGFDAEVEAVDGVGAVIKAVMEIDNIHIADSGYAYSVGDEFEIQGLPNEKKTNLKIQVDSITGVATPELKNFKILNYGSGYTTTRVALIKNQNVSYNSTTNVLSLTGAATQITGISVAHYKPDSLNTQFAVDAAAKSPKYATSIVDVEVTTYPTPHADLADSYLIFNGIGATATANLTADEITSYTIGFGGINYANPKVRISDATGIGAVGEVVKNSNGVVTGITVIAGGSGYTAPTLQIYDAAGSGFIATAICDTVAAGKVASVSMVGGDLGEFINLPPNSENIPYSTTSEGYAAKFDITYKVKSLHVENTGYGYQAINSPELKFTGGIGSGFTFIPIIDESTILTNIIITNGGNDYATASTIKFTGGTVDATANLTVVNGAITQVTITGGGSGFTYDPMDASTNCVAVIDEIGPSAAQAEPDVTISLGGNGEILDAVIISRGSNYTTASVLIDGDYTTPATLVANIFTGVDIIKVTSIGLPNAFNINSLNTWNRITDKNGISQVLTEYTTTISGGTGGKVSCYVTKEGQLAVDSNGDPMIWISVAGTGYTTPTATVGDVVGKIPTVYFGCSRGISSITVSDGGSGYSASSTITIVGDGQNAKATPTIAGSLGVESVTINATANTNKGFITSPTITIEDTSVSRIGKISKIKIINGGTGFRKFPRVKCEEYDIVNTTVGGHISQIQVPKPDRTPTPTGYLDYGIGAKLIAVSKSIGRVKNINQKEFGFGYEDVPEVKFPVSLVVRDTTGFRLNEPVSSSPSSTRDISSSLVKITTNGTSTVVMYLSDSPSSLGIFSGQKITVSGLHANVNKTYNVKSINLIDKTVQLNGGIAFTQNEYINVSATLILTEKAGKIVSIDNMRNMIWVDNVDNIFDCVEDVGYLSEDGDTIVTEFFAAIKNDTRLYGHNSGRTSEIVWMNKAYFASKRSAVGATAKYFTSKNSLLSEKGIRTLNSMNIQDYSFEVHTGLSLNFYEKLLRDTVHPAGYYMQGVLDDVEVITDYLRMSLAGKRTGTLGDEVFLSVQLALASLYALQKTKETTKYLYQNRDYLSSKTLLRSLDATTTGEFDLWAYPDHSIWRTDEDGKNHYNWLYTHLPPLETSIYSGSFTLDYTQTSDEITYYLTGHSFSVGDVFMHITPSDDLCGRSFTVYTKPDANSFTTKNTLFGAISGDDVKIIKVMSAPISATFTKTGSIFTITKTSHGLIGDANTWVYVDIPTGNDTGVQYKTRCCKVINATTNTFQIDGLSDDVISGETAGNMSYRRYTPSINTLVKQARVRDVSYSINATVVTVSGLPSTHDLQVGNILLVETSSGIYDYVAITERTSTTIKFDDIGITGNLDISFTFDGYIPAIGYRN